MLCFSYILSAGHVSGMPEVINNRNSVLYWDYFSNIVYIYIWTLTWTTDVLCMYECIQLSSHHKRILLYKLICICLSFVCQTMVLFFKQNWNCCNLSQLSTAVGKVIIFSFAAKKQVLIDVLIARQTLQYYIILTGLLSLALLSDSHVLE